MFVEQVRVPNFDDDLDRVELRHLPSEGLEARFERLDP